jgi:outer membrane protein assembly factor BamE (lipoprotein component of BamABCDE complex)
MNSHVSRILLALSTTIMLGACASLSNTHEATPGKGALAQVHYGLTQDQVRSLAGSPKEVRRESRLGEAVWIYYYTDEENYASEFDVSFNSKGVVSDLSTERIRY